MPVASFDPRAEDMNPDRGSLFGAVARACTSAVTGRGAFRRQLAEYLAAVPTILLGSVAKFVRVDSARTARGLLWDSYQIGYFLSDVREPNPELDTLLAKPLTLRRSADAKQGVMFVGSFESIDGFDRARQRFEHNAAVWFYARLNAPEPHRAEPKPATVAPELAPVPALAASPPIER